MFKDFSSLQRADGRFLYSVIEFAGRKAQKLADSPGISSHEWMSEEWLTAVLRCITIYHKNLHKGSGILQIFSR